MSHLNVEETAYLHGSGPGSVCSLASEHCKLICRLSCLFQQPAVWMINKKKSLREAGLRRLQLTVGYKLYIHFNAKPLVLFGNIYLICQLPTPCCGLGLVNKQCWTVSEVWSILSSGSGFGAFCLRRTLVQYCNMCALKPCQRIVTYCVMPFMFYVFCFNGREVDNCFSTLIFL